MRVVRSWLLLACLAGCGDKDDDSGLPTGGTDTTDGGSDGVDDCWTTRPDDCAAAPGCVEMTAREVVSDGAEGWCVDYSADAEVVGCMPADVGCGGALSYATPSALPDSCFEFPSTCTVAGWGACSLPAMESPGECSD